MEMFNPYLEELRDAQRLPDARERRRRIADMLQTCDENLDAVGREGDLASAAYRLLKDGLDQERGK